VPDTKEKVLPVRDAQLVQIERVCRGGGIGQKQKGVWLRLKSITRATEKTGGIDVASNKREEGEQKIGGQWRYGRPEPSVKERPAVRRGKRKRKVSWLDQQNAEGISIIPAADQS